MENRERDRVSQRTTPTEAGDINRHVSEEKGRENSGTGTEFGQKIGRSENLEGGTMENRNKSGMDKMENEESRRPSGDRDFDSNIERSDLNENESSRSINRGGSMGGDRNSDSSEGRH